jgi:hypothetical protein
MVMSNLAFPAVAVCTPKPIELEQNRLEVTSVRVSEDDDVTTRLQCGHVISPHLSLDAVVWTVRLRCH